MSNLNNILSAIIASNQSTGEVRRDEERKAVDKQHEIKEASKTHAFSAYKVAADKADKAAFSVKSVLGASDAVGAKRDVSAQATQARAKVMADFFASPEGQIILASGL